MVSIAAGITTAQLDRWLGGGLAVVRAMPNTPALLGAGVTGLFANARVDAAGAQRAEALLAAAGPTVWIDDEARMDAVTARVRQRPGLCVPAGRGDAGRGRSRRPAGRRRAHAGAADHPRRARMLTEGDETPAELRRRVTSPGGTTQAAIETFEAGGFRELVARAIHAATERGRELSAAND